MALDHGRKHAGRLQRQAGHVRILDRHLNGSAFVPDQTDPQWLDWGNDWYASVTWPDAANPDTSRYAIGWMNNWHYAPHTVPTDSTDNYNGQMSVVRQLSLKSEGSGVYSLLSQPTPNLANYATKP